MKQTLHTERLLRDVVVKARLAFADVSEQLTEVKENTGLQFDDLLNKPFRGIIGSYLMIAFE